MYKINFYLQVLFGITFLITITSYASQNDEIDFFNVGQGHAALVHKKGTDPHTHKAYAPLLIDAGSTSHPYETTESYSWKKTSTQIVGRISEKILNFWKNSHQGNLFKGEFHLNVIVTHPDEDHKEFIPSVLEKLRLEAKKYRSLFSCTILLGGSADLYPDYLPGYQKVYSVECLGLYTDTLPIKLGSFFKSGAISHLFCSEGIKSDHNRWSIVTRVNLEEISAVFTGDADCKVKKQMIPYLKGRERDLKSDILLIPHHGALKTYHEPWDQAVSPSTIIIGAAPTSYRHPRGEILLKHFTTVNSKDHLWKYVVMPHAIQYYCNKDVNNNIKECFREAGERLFDEVPTNTITDLGQGEGDSWHLVWTDAPVYTLWTTGTLYFRGGVRGLCCIKEELVLSY